MEGRCEVRGSFEALMLALSEPALRYFAAIWGRSPVRRGAVAIWKTIRPRYCQRGADAGASNEISARGFTIVMYRRATRQPEKRLPAGYRYARAANDLAEFCCAIACFSRCPRTV
jgi:hypothetical protein